MIFPKTRLIIPTAGDDEALYRLLDSMRRFRFFDKRWLEVVIVDNTQSHVSSNKVKAVIKPFPSILLMRVAAKGKAYAINEAIATTDAEFVAFLDDDAVVVQWDHLETMLQHMINTPTIGYVSGKVAAINADINKVAGLWERKGGLSKGETLKYWDHDYLRSKEFRLKPWQFNKLCAGANSVIRREAIVSVGPFHILLEGHDGFSAGATIQIGYRIAAAGYELLYDPRAQVGHIHPTDKKTMRRKLFSYGQGDTAYQMANFILYGDWRCFFWAYFGHPWYTLSKKIVPSLAGRYPLSVRDLLFGMSGNATGATKYLYIYFLKNRRRALHEYEINWKKIASQHGKAKVK